jgi:hypothetical protein
MDILINSIKELDNALKVLVNQNLEKESAISYKGAAKDHYTKIIKNKIFEIKKFSGNLNSSINELEMLKNLKDLIDKFDENKSTKENLFITEKLLQLYPESKQFSIELPSAINEDVNRDFEEMNLCFKAGCYRSVVILCGRIMETALHRKYYEITGKDILETSPGIGLGKLIAKLKELSDIDPGLTQQIHIVNQVRIHSVHKKEKTFSPSRIQAEAIMLYTKEILSKMF